MIAQREPAHQDEPSRRDHTIAQGLKKFTALCQPVSPWRQRAVATLAGAASVLAMAPFHLWPVLWLTLPALLLVCDAAAAAHPAPKRWRPWQRFATGRMAETGWWFGFGYHLAGLFWIVEPFLVEAEVFAWLIPLAVTLMPAGLALFTATATAALGWTRPGARLERIAVLAIAFGITEWLRGHILTGFPWNVLGYALTWPLPLMQSAGLLGIYGLTVLAVLIFAAPYAALRISGSRSKTWPVFASIATLAALFVHGQWRLAANPPAAVDASAPVVRIVQPSIPQRERMQPGNMRRNFDRHLELSRTAPDGTNDAAASISVLVWPEAAMPFVALAQPIALADIGELLQLRTKLVAGALRAEPGLRPGSYAVFNSLLAFEGGTPARHVATYDKIHLVPFGEYLPAQPFLETIGLEQITRQRGGFAAGAGPRQLLDIPGLGRVLPLICYEAIFPGLLRPAMGRPDLLLTLTNDGWFGTLTGPRQHYHQGRVRAVETAVPLLRASSNGISALVDPLGRERGRLDLNAAGTLDVKLPPVLAPTPYARMGDGLAAALVALLGLVLAIQRSRLRTT